MADATPPPPIQSSMISAGSAVDILVRAPEDGERRLRRGDSFITEVMTRSQVMSEAQHA